MAKLRRTTLDNNNSRLTDFFSSQPHSSSSQQRVPSSSPASSSTPRQSQKALSQSKQPPLSTSQQFLPATRFQAKMAPRASSSQLRTMKKENAPPPPSQIRTPAGREVICISSSSDAPTLISISSTSALSADHSIVEVLPPPSQNRRLLQVIDVSSPAGLPQPRRKSLRLQGARGVPRCESSPKVPSSQTRKAPVRKRKKPEGVQSDDGDVIDLDAMQDVIYVSSKPSQIEHRTPELSTPAPVESRIPSARKRSRLIEARPAHPSPDVVEIIPSSQSDERELSLAKKSQKNLEGVKDSVREWQLSSSQADLPPESDDPYDASREDNGMDIDLNYTPSSSPAGRSRTRSSAPVKNRVDVSFHATPCRDLQTRTPSKSSSSRKASTLAILSSPPIPSGSKPTSPTLPSSASSLTKVDTSAAFSMCKKALTPLSSPRANLITEGTVSPCRPSLQAAINDPGLNSVVLMDQNKKTAEVVERIKAEARAKAKAMQDESLIDLGSLNDSDSDLDSPPNLFSQYVKGKGSAKSGEKSLTPSLLENDDKDGSPFTDGEDLDRCSSRINNAHWSARRSLSPISSTTAGGRIRKTANKLPSLLSDAARLPSKKKKTANPFTKLLKEKSKEDRFAAIRYNPNIDHELHNSDPAENAPTQGPSSPAKPISRQHSDGVEGENIVDEADRRRLFGEEDNNVLGKILESDRQDKGNSKAVVEELGVPFWDPYDNQTMESDLDMDALPVLDNPCQDSSIEMMNEFIRVKDVDGIMLLLQSGIFAISKAGSIVEWLFEIAICRSGTLALAACTVLEQVCASPSKGGRLPVVSISPVLKALSVCGARRDILESLDLQLPLNSGQYITGVRCSRSLWRLSQLIATFGSKGMLIEEDIPAYFALLLAIGLDGETDRNLRSSIKRALHILASSCRGKVPDERSVLERQICSKVACMIGDLTPANKDYLLSFIDGDSLIERRIGQWIAFAMLTSTYGVEMAKTAESGPPSLSDILALLDPHLDTELRSDLFDVSRNHEQIGQIDYAALTHHVEVLGRVLMNIPQYMHLEKAAIGRDSLAGRGASGRRNDTNKLESIRALLGRLGNNITDTRAAHLDRSQAKAVILQLAMRLQYQMKSVKSGVKIDTYFKANVS